MYVKSACINVTLNLRALIMTVKGYVECRGSKIHVSCVTSNLMPYSPFDLWVRQIRRSDLEFHISHFFIMI